MRAYALLLFGWAFSALGAPPDETWKPFKGEAPPGDVEAVVPPPLPPGERSRRNRTSLHGAVPLGPLGFGVEALVSLPDVSVRAGLGVSPSVDLGVSLTTVYGQSFEIHGWGRWTILDDNLALAAVLEAGGAAFARPAGLDLGGVRWLTGRHNYDVEAGGIVSYQSERERASRFYADLRYVMAIDREPVPAGPLQPTPVGVQALHSIQLKLGAEVYISRLWSVLFFGGGSVHLGGGDAALTPFVGAGVVTGWN